MFTIMKSRGWSRLWDPGSQSLATKTCKGFGKVPGPRHTFTPRTQRASFWSRPQFRKDTPKKTSTPTKRFASCGLLFIDAGPNTTASSPITQGTTTIETSLYSTPILASRSIPSTCQTAWRREIHSTARRRRAIATKRNKSSASNGQNGSKLTPNGGRNSKSPPPATPAKPSELPKEKIPPSESHSYLHLPHLPHMPHRPSREELLAAATGFWSRLKVRFKWFSIRSTRPWNVDDWSAFASWFVLGNIVWVFVGTTTFFSLVIFSINTVFAQETLARWIGDYLTQSAGIKVVFESAVVPKWKNGVITFHNVFVSRRPGQEKAKVRKGSSITAAAAAAAERQAESELQPGEEEEDTNYTQFDVTIGTVNVTLSFVKWWNGKGLLRDVEIKGVRGVIDRTLVHWGSEYVDPRSYRHEHHLGDFEMDSFKMEDLLVTIHQPNGFRPFSVSIFSCELPQLRKQWLFYDFLSANNMSGAFDGSLFTIHPRQVHGFAGAHHEEQEEEGNPWKKHSRLRIDGLKIDHLNRGVDGPFGWIHEGNVDIVADVMLPAEADDSIVKVMSDFYDRMEATVTSNRYMHILERSSSTADLLTPENRAAAKKEKLHRDDDKRFLVMDLRVHLNDVKAAVPLFTRDLSYINQALIRPIVAYINSQKTFIPINCRIVKRASEFDGSWTIFDSGLMEDLSAETYEAFAKDVVDTQQRMRRLKKVGFWSISLAIQALFMGMAGNIA
ncbi:mitochondrial distribution and morphology protein-like protein 31 [Amylocarpus encephaloides]|uniref:Mitochondrial distribution and morphology protein-like protein 31 n=1 Tax=Amylocarpus encephaloides TaxID=45428 RepID=A0A9P7YNM5_9HELO|nr:mitochondrial distribution and morphology protein-like protein 31 [Amylocarpus encephaloides]